VIDLLLFVLVTGVIVLAFGVDVWMLFSWARRWRPPSR
jgi:hypothetical protein